MFENCKNPDDLYKAIKKALDTRANHPPNAFSSNMSRNKLKFFAEAEDRYIYEDTTHLYHNARTKALELLAKNKKLQNIPEPQTDPICGLQTIAQWCLETQQNKSTKQKRGKGLLKEHIKEAYEALFDDSKANQIAKWINNEYSHQYTTVTEDNVRKTDEWIKRHSVKK